ncbi:hypothetical protein ACU4GD_13575 [Cupriavidus basilensis]
MASGGATGAGVMAMLARASWRARAAAAAVLVVAGENRLSGQSSRPVDPDAGTGRRAGDGSAKWRRRAGVLRLAGFALSCRDGHARRRAQRLRGADARARLRAIPTPTCASPADWRGHAARAAGPIATPLRLSDCCPISDGAVALVVSAGPGSSGTPVRPARARRIATSTCCAPESVLATGNWRAAARRAAWRRKPAARCARMIGYRRCPRSHSPSRWRTAAGGTWRGRARCVPARLAAGSLRPRRARCRSIRARQACAGGARTCSRRRPRRPT